MDHLYRSVLCDVRPPPEIDNRRNVYLCYVLSSSLFLSFLPQNLVSNIRQYFFPYDLLKRLVSARRQVLLDGCVFSAFLLPKRMLSLAALNQSLSLKSLHGAGKETYSMFVMGRLTFSKRPSVQDMSASSDSPGSQETLLVQSLVINKRLTSLPFCP